MTNQKTKNTLIIDHDDEYILVIRKTTGEIQLSASFSLAEQSIRSKERLRQLIDFIQRNNQGSARRIQNGESVGISQRLTAQVVYLAYWENYPLVFRIEGGDTPVVLVCISRQPESTIVLDVFKDGLDPYHEIQGWWNFFCETISTHAAIWHIPLVIDESVYHRLAHGGYSHLQIEIVPKYQDQL
jgi:hypothetical protein